MYKVELSEKARESYLKADRPLAQKLARCFSQLEKEPSHHSNIKRLAGKLSGHYRYRVGDYRVIYRIDERQEIVFVLRIAHRRQAYD